MKRAALVVPCLLLGALLPGCAVGGPQPATYISDTGATLNGDVYSSVSGDTEYWWKYGETTAYGQVTPHRTIAISDSVAHPVSEPLSGLSAGTTYHYGMCVQDSEESPPRVVCSKDQTFTTSAQEGTSGIAFIRSNTVFHMGAGGEDPTALTTSGFKGWPAWSPDGTKIAYVDQAPGNPEIFVMDADGGNPHDISNDTSADFTPAWSPDGSRIAFQSDRDGDYEIYVMDPDGGNVVQLTDNDTFDQSASWSPDGRRIAFSSRRDDANDQIWVMNADGSGAVRLTASEPGTAQANVSPQWSPDGRRIAFLSTRGPAGIYVMDADGTNETPVATEAESTAGPLSWSPDGSRIAFESMTGGESEILVMNADGSAVTNITNDPAHLDDLPAWSRRP